MLVLFSAGLALASVVVVGSHRGRPDELTTRDLTSLAVETLAATIALAALVASAYVSVYVLIGNHDSQFSLVAWSDASQKVGYISLAGAREVGGRQEPDEEHGLHREMREHFAIRPALVTTMQGPIVLSDPTTWLAVATGRESPSEPFETVLPLMG